MSDRRTRKGFRSDPGDAVPARRRDQVVRLDVLEPMVRSGPITGYAPWAPKSKSATRVWAAIGAYAGSVRPQTRIAHHWAHQVPASSRGALKVLKHGVQHERAD